MNRRQRTDAGQLVRNWADALPAFLSVLPADDPLREVREQAIAHFADQGLPDRKQESWRHTSLADLEEVAPAAPGVLDLHTTDRTAEAFLDPSLLPRGDFQRAVFVDGEISERLSTLDNTGLEALCLGFGQAVSDPVGSAALRSRLGELADTKRDAFTALNAAYMHGGALVRIPAGCSASRPLHLLFVWSRQQSLQCPRILVLAEAGSEAVVLVEHVSLAESNSLTNGVCEIFLDEGARLHWIVIERPGELALRVSNLRSTQARDSWLGLHMLSLSGRFIRNEISARLADAGAEVELNGLLLAAGTRLVDHHTEIDHAMPLGRSRQLYKGVLAGDAQGVFRGMIRVSPHAQKSDSSLSNPNLLLSDRARIETKPQLEIHADDVKCSHGSTVGRLDQEALLYLQTRGIGRNEARNILTRGFANEICDRLPSQELRDFARSLVSKTLSSFSTSDPGESA